MPKCVVCDIELTYDEKLYIHLGRKIMDINWKGTCPLCKLSYAWWEHIPIKNKRME